MRAYMDDTAIEVGRETLAGAIASGVEHAHRSGRIVVEVRADGRQLTGDELDTPTDDTGVDEVRMISAEPRALVSVTLGEAADALDDVRVKHTEAAEHVQRGTLDDAIVAMELVLGAWQAARAALEHGSLVLGENLVDGIDGATEQVNGLAAQLSELQGALTNQDWSVVADVLAYDLEPRAGTWGVLLRAASKNAMKGSAERDTSAEVG